PLPPHQSSSPARSIFDSISALSSSWRRRKLPAYLFLALCLNAIFAPAVFAATGGELHRLQAWAIALLGITTVSLSTYLFVVMFQPEKF
ncbi:MAG TPA: potassium-transporting ATPase subunit F, partial [Coleofasciculaceae cyanobacterium]